MPLTKTPLSITFHPAYDRNIAGPKPVSWPGTFDGGAASGANAASDTSNGGYEALLHGDIFLMPYSYDGRWQIAGGAFAIKQSSNGGPYKLARFFGSVAAPSGKEISWKKIASASATGITERGNIFSCEQSGYGGMEHYALELCWGARSDEISTDLYMPGKLPYPSSSPMYGSQYTDTGSVSGDLEAANAGGSWGSKVRYRKFTGESQESIYIGGSDGGKIRIYTGYISSPTAQPSWRTESAEDRISSADEHYGSSNNRLTRGVGRWWGGGFDVNQGGKFAVAWCAEVNEGMCVCIWTGTINSAGEIDPSATMNGVAKVFVPYVAEYNGNVPSNSKFWEGTPGSSNTYLFYNPSGSEAEGSSWPPRHPQVVVTEGNPAYVYIQLGMKHRAEGHLGMHEWTTGWHTVNDAGNNMSQGWSWSTSSDFRGNWGTACDHNPDGNDVYFICKGIPMYGSAGDHPSTFRQSSFLDEFMNVPGWQFWGLTNFAFKRCKDVNGSSVGTYMCAGGVSYTQRGEGIWIPLKQYGIVYAPQGTFGSSPTFDVGSGGIGKVIEICSYGDIT